MTALTLALHADWRCARSGACCSSGWAIAIESVVAARVVAAQAAGCFDLRNSLAGITSDVARLWPPVDDQPAEFAGVLRRDAQGRCLLLEPGPVLACALHKQLGSDALPVACRTFPRLVRHERGQTFLSLSHHCPSVAARLFTETPEHDHDALLTLVADAPVTAGAERHEGLDAREALPPLLRPDALLDEASQALWERHVLDVLARSWPAEQALDLLAAQAERARAWHVRHGSLPDWLAAALVARRDEDDDVAHALRRVHGWAPEPIWPAALFDALRLALPAALRAQVAAPPPAHADSAWVAPFWSTFARPSRRYLAARACAGWSLHQGRGLRAYVLDLGLALAVLRAQAGVACARAGRALDRSLFLEAVRAADLLLLHWASREALADALSACEV